MFQIFPPKSRITEINEDFALEQDNWNDYSFRTQYHLYVSAKLAEQEEPEFIGTIKILKKGQTTQDGILIDDDFDSLENEFGSVGASLDYYQRLNSLNEKVRNRILSALNDVVWKPELAEVFSTEEGWETSMFRDNKDIQGFIRDAHTILSGNYTELPELDADIKFTPKGWSSALSINFDPPSEPNNYEPTTLPHRCLVLIGRNGSGKSTLLFRLARVAYASPSDRQRPELRAIGMLQPDSIGFMRIITISYSAFDSFTVPGVYRRDLEQIAKDIDRQEGRFLFCGLRDIARELREYLDENINNDENQNQILLIGDRQKSTHLKSLDKLAEEFEDLIRSIEKQGRWRRFERAMAPVLRDSSFSDLEERSVIGLIGEKPSESFKQWSTGHKIAVHVIASIVAYSVDRSLILFDEPETHLHPPMGAALMHGVRIALRQNNAFAIIATHSPVILQETLSRHVRIVTRYSDQIEISNPRMETFGENTGILTYDIFGLRGDDTDFHNVLDTLVEQYDDIESIEKLFPLGLSGQARAYVMTKLLEQDKK